MTRSDADVVISWYNEMCATSTDLVVAMEYYGDDLQAFTGVLHRRAVASSVSTPIAENLFFALLCRPFTAYMRIRERILDEAEDSQIRSRLLVIDAHNE